MDISHYVENPCVLVSRQMPIESKCRVSKEHPSVVRQKIFSRAVWCTYHLRINLVGTWNCCQKSKVRTAGQKNGGWWMHHAVVVSEMIAQ
jgi:hypothetical protein